MTVTERISTIETPSAVSVRRLSYKSVKELTKTNKPIVSIYMDTYIQGEEQSLGAKQLERIIPHIRQELIEQGITEYDADTYIEPLKNLVQDNKAWYNMEQGLAIFVTEHEASMYKLFYDAEFSWTVDNKIRLHPIVKELEHKDRFLILSVTQDKVKLLRANKKYYKNIPLTKVPHNIDEAVPEDQMEKTHLGRSGNGNSVAFHGQDHKESENARVEKFLKIIAENLKSELPDNDDRPYIILCPPQYMAIFKETLKHKEIAFIQGSYAHLSDEELYNLSLPVYDEEIHRMDTFIKEIINTGENTKNIERSTQAIYDLAKYERGRIDTLIVEPIIANGSEDVERKINNIDETIYNVVQGDGHVIAYKTECDFPMTAILRY